MKNTFYGYYIAGVKMRAEKVFNNEEVFGMILNKLLKEGGE
ncbi:hypothetical protein [Porphyromonas gulae]|nr:hypothetical protein [Porphyromonas gulae]